MPCPAHKSTRSARLGFQRVLLGSFPPPCLDPGGGAEVAARPAASPARYSLAASPLQHRPDRAMSAEPELIELRELAPSGRIGPGRTRLERANALRIAPGTTRNPSQQHVPGRGTVSSLQGPPRTRGATSVETSSGASCARAYSARVSKRPHTASDYGKGGSTIVAGQAAVEGWSVVMILQTRSPGLAPSGRVLEKMVYHLSRSVRAQLGRVSCL